MKDNRKFSEPMISSKAVTKIQKILYGNFEKSFLKCEKWLFCGVKRTPHCCLNFDFLDFDVYRLDSLETIASTWRKNVLRYLSADIICFEKRKVFRERSSRKAVCFVAKRNIQIVFCFTTLSLAHSYLIEVWERWSSAKVVGTFWLGCLTTNFKRLGLGGRAVAIFYSERLINIRDK